MPVENRPIIGPQKFDLQSICKNHALVSGMVLLMATRNSGQHQQLRLVVTIPLFTEGFGMHPRWWSPDFWTVKTSWLENGPWMKMYFLVKIGKFQPAMLVYWRVVSFWPGLTMGFFNLCFVFCCSKQWAVFIGSLCFPDWNQRNNIFFVGQFLQIVPYTRTATLPFFFNVTAPNGSQPWVPGT